MDIVEQFKEHLLREKSKPSKVTIKNYLSDIRRFISWYEKTYSQTFHPFAVSSDITKTYKDNLVKGAKNASTSASSIKRYISSLRKFTSFLVDSGAIETNPFEVSPTVKAVSDPWLLRQFKNQLILQHASRLTIKNYLIDIQQFLNWLAEVTKDQENIEIENRFLQIDHFAVTQYKKRLINDAKLSPTSINRKLSSLRRYLRWLTEKGVLASEPDEVATKNDETTTTDSVKETALVTDLPLATLLEVPTEKELPQNEKSYSSFAPIRLGQKISKLTKLGLTAMFVLPLTKSYEALEYALWKKQGKQVFTPVKDILEQAGYVIPVTEAVEPAKTVTETIAKVTASKSSLMKDFIAGKSIAKPYAVRNISKAFYAPLKISITHLPFREKLWHHIRYTRPDWYRTYHSYPIVHHIHLSILLIATSAAGLGIYFTATEPTQVNKPVYASFSNSPPRTISFSGTLTDTNNAPITAETTLRFTLYNSEVASGAALLWQETQTIKPNQNGTFATELGKKARLSQELFSQNANLYIGMTVGANQELRPRQEIPTTELADDSESLQGLKPITKDITITENVILALDSSGDLTIGGSASPTFRATGGEFTLSGQAVSLTTLAGSNGNITLAPDGAGIVDIQRPLRNTTDYNEIGTSGGAVRIADELDVTTLSNNRTAFTINQNGSGDILSGNSNGDAKFRLDAMGNALFAGNLVVNGNTIGTNSESFGIAVNNVRTLSIGSQAQSISLGDSSGVTTINNSIEVDGTSTLHGSVNTDGLLTANGGLSIPTGQTISIADFAAGAIPYINSAKVLAQDINFSWNDQTNALNVGGGSLCVNATTANCAGSAAGTIYAANATVQAADLAENYISAENLEPGDIVVPEGKGNSLAIIRSTSAYQPQVIGIISTKPGFTLNSDAQTTTEYPNLYALALQGRVPVKVSNSNGKIEAGDPLTASSIPGVAMKATGSGQIIGKALESYETEEQSIGKIMVFVNLSHFESPTKLTASGDLAAEQVRQEDIKTITDDQYALLDSLTITDGVIEKFAASLITATDISTKSLQVLSEDVTINGKALNEYIKIIVKESIENAVTDLSQEKLAEKNINQTPQASTSAGQQLATLASQSATFGDQQEASQSATSLNEPNRYNSIASSSALENSLPEAEKLDMEIALSSMSGQLKDFNGRLNILEKQSQIEAFEASSAADLSLGSLGADDVTLSESLTVLGRTTLSDVGITGNVTIGLITIKGLDESGQASINTSAGPLLLQEHGLYGIDFMDGKVAIDTKGNLNVNGTATFAKDVTVKGTLAANIIAPIPGSDLTVKNNNGKEVVRINEQGDLRASGSGSFANLTIVRGAQADTSRTVTQANASAGKGTIRSHEVERTIYTPYVTENSLIYVTPTSDSHNIVPYIARQTVSDPKHGIKGSFTVRIPNELTKDISFNWWIVN